VPVAVPTPIVETVPSTAPARPWHEKVPSGAVVAEHTVAPVVWFETVTAWPAANPDPVATTDPFATPTDGSSWNKG
jgi:hypothetical protein